MPPADRTRADYRLYGPEAQARVGLVRTLRLHQAMLKAVASRGTATPEERRLISDFIDDTFTSLDLGPDFLPMMRAAMPGLPDEPTEDQVNAWVELARLVQEPGFRRQPPAGGGHAGPGPCGNPRRTQP